jgi:alkylation response protein AidB-like acyl-CoA dehydrogenase
MTNVIEHRHEVEAVDTREMMRDSLVGRAGALFPVLRGNAGEADKTRRLPQANIDALAASGIFKLWVPKRYGGYEADPRTYVEVLAELSRADASTSWAVSLITAMSFMVGQFPEAGQDAVYGADPEARVCGVLTPAGSAERSSGGYIVRGSWPFASGCLHSTWCGVVTPLLDAEGNVANVGYVLMPMSDITIKDTWFTVGMRGTGSNTLVADEVFVPDHLVLPLVGPTGMLDGDPLTPFKNEVLYQAPQGSLGVLSEIGTILGLGRAALETVLEQLPKRSIAYTTYTRQIDAASTQIDLGEAATRIDAAHLLAYRAAEDIDRAITAARKLDLPARARIRADLSFAARTVREAVDTLVQLCGASAMAEFNYLQQIQRDVNTVSLHGLLRASVCLEVYGATLCGLEPTTMPLV